MWKAVFDSQVEALLTEFLLSHVAGGTGDIAFRMKARAPDAAITVFDLNAEMLRVGRDRSRLIAGSSVRMTGSANSAEREQLPSADNAFDVYTIAFGLRNVTHIDTALVEARGCLGPVVASLPKIWAGRQPIFRYFFQYLFPRCDPEDRCAGGAG